MIAPVVAGLVNTTAGLVIAHGAWWTLVCLVALPRSKQAPITAPALQTLAVVIPAHNEAGDIARCLASLSDAAEGARMQPRVIVVADNCSDETAAIARSAGATVLERVEPTRRGKPYAISFAIDWLRDGPAPDAVVFLDADSEVNRDFLAALAARMAAGERAVQAYYSAAECESEMQRLRRLALMLIHWSRPLGLSRLGLGTGFKGNGMLVAWELAAEGLGAEGIAEDAAMTLALGRRGVIVAFEPRAVVTGRMPRDYRSARTQDRRWEGGRMSLAPRALAQAARGLLHGHVREAATAFEVASLPLSLLVFMATATCAVSGAGPGSAMLSFAAAASLLTYIGVGLAAARPRPRDLLALATVPRFLAYKASVFAGLLLHGRPRNWERTSRDLP